MTKFLLIDDHAIVRSGIKFWLASEYNPSEIDEAGDGKEAEEKIQSKDYDLLLMDIQIPGTNTLELLKYILTIKPETRVLMFSMNSEDIYAKRFFKAGAKGFLSKVAPIEEIKKAVYLTLNNRKYFSNEFIENILTEKEENPFHKLSDREFEITTLMLEGKTVTEIAAELNIAMSTTGTHKARVFEKLNINNIMELTKLAELYEIKK